MVCCCLATACLISISSEYVCLSKINVKNLYEYTRYYCILCFSVPVAELVQGSYNILENVSPLSVCLTLNGAILERPVVVTISTTPGTALGKKLPSDVN